MSTDAERNRWLLKYLIRHQLLVIEVCQPEAGMTPAPFWVLRAPAVIDRGSCLGYAKTEDAAIDAAMKESP